MPWWGVAAIVLAFLVVFPLWWSLVVWLIGSGWRSIAAAFPELMPPDASAKSFSCQSGHVSARYSGVLNIALSRSHLHLRTLKIFSPGHPPIAIPWHALSNLEKCGFLKGWSSLQAKLQMPDGREKKILLPRSVWEASPLKLPAS